MDPMHRADLLLDAAISALRSGDSTLAFERLQDSVATAYVNPLAHYLLGVEHAQRGRYGDAVLHLTVAGDQSPTLWVARLQLGLLWLTLGAPSAALSQLQGFSALPADTPLRLFADGLAAAASSDLPAAIGFLTEGLKHELDNKPLAADMQRLLDTMQAAVVASDHGRAPEAASASHGMAISAYTGSKLGGL